VIITELLIDFLLREVIAPLRSLELKEVIAPWRSLEVKAISPFVGVFSRSFQQEFSDRN
jgi:hypothetical protein